MVEHAWLMVSVYTVVLDVATFASPFSGFRMWWIWWLQVSHIVILGSARGVYFASKRKKQ